MIRPRSAALFAAAALASLVAEAQPYDPARRFETLETPHFLVHFHDGEESLAQLVARYGERAHELLVPLVGHEPQERTHLVLIDLDDSANGSAIPVPYNTIELRAAPPDSRGELNDFEDWLWQLVVHEYTHILHLDHIRGPAFVANRLFGKRFWPNGAWPRWFAEGWAVHLESKLSTGGRVRSSLQDMALRTQVLEGTMFDLDTLSSPPLRFPRGGAWYLYGGYFLDWIAEHYGEGALRTMAAENAATLIPYQLEEIARRATGEGFAHLYAAWRADLETRYEAQRARLGAITGERLLTTRGEKRRTPRLSPDGRTLYSLLLDADARPRVMALDLASGVEEVLAEVNGDGAFAVAPDGTLVIGQPDVQRQFTFYEDIFTISPESGRIRRLTEGLRLSEPDVASDGRVVAVRRTGAARMALVTAANLEALSRGELATLRESEGHAPLGSPRFSPDGRHVAFLEHRHGSWDLRLLEFATGTLTELTDDGAQELNPAFSSDGARVLFSSDRSGIFDLYDLEVATGILRRRTKVLGGAFEPLEIDGVLHYVRYGSRGHDLARFEGPTLAEAPPDAPPARPSTLSALHDDGVAPVRPYALRDTIFPTWWLPVVGADPDGVTLGASLGGRDVLQKYDYGASAEFGLLSHEPQFAARLSVDALWPSLEFVVSRHVYDRVPGAPKDYVESDLGGSATASWIFRRPWSSWRINLFYGLDSLGPARPFTLTPDGVTAPERGLLGTVGAVTAWSNARRFVRSISNEEGRRISLEIKGSSPLVGSDFTLARGTASWSEFVRIPFLAHHVLALRAVGGLSVGELGGRSLFGLGGPRALNVLNDLYTLQSPTRILRGYPQALLSGRAFTLLTAEYRFPITDLELGHQTWPVSLRRLHGALVADAGDAWNPGTSHLDLRLGVGAELRAEVVFGYALTADLRIGYARGLNASGEHQLLLLAGTHF